MQIYTESHQNTSKNNIHQHSHAIPTILEPLKEKTQFVNNDDQIVPTKGNPLVTPEDHHTERSELYGKNILTFDQKHMDSKAIRRRFMHVAWGWDFFLKRYDFTFFHGTIAGNTWYDFGTKSYHRT